MPSRGLTPRHPIVPISLSFCSGLVDVVCFLGLFGSLTAFITGTVIILCSELFHTGGAVWLRVLILVTFFVSATVWVNILNRLTASGRPVVRISLALEALLLLLFLAATLALPQSPKWFSAGTALALVLATTAMSLQNATMQIVLHFHNPTTVMTGNAMKMLMSLMPAGGTGGHDRSEVRRYAMSLIAFVLGGLLGGFGLTEIGFAILAVPVALLAGLALLQRV